MKKVHVVFKTHLDLGFTDLAANVLKNYNDNYIPRAVELAFELNQEEATPKFIWTTGSYLIWQYLDTQPKDKIDRLVKAIESGYISWHGMPATFHSEAVGKFVFEDAINITHELDLRFNRKTISSKMTDVPGHTKAIVPILAKNGIKFMHIGMNGVSALPKVPQNFIWEHEGEELIVSYSNDYGADVEIEGCDDILVFAHTHDNSGPQSKQKILDVYEQLEKKYPGYQIMASTIDAYVEVLLNSEYKLPVVNEEIGDTWIHGVASDPKKMREYNILCGLIENWVEEGTLSKQADNYNHIIANLMLIPEHTWGMDIKRYFSDYKNYTKADFEQAREVDQITDDALTFRYKDIGIATEPEMQYTSYEWDMRSYSLYESSWKEQRLYIDNIINLLPTELQNIARNSIQENDIKTSGKAIRLYSPITIGDFTVLFDNTGSICSLIKDNIEYASDNNVLFKLEYTVTGNDSYEKLRTNYLRDLDKHFWAVDFLKPGTELQNEIINTQTTSVIVEQITQKDNKVYIKGYMDSKFTEKFGAPRKVTIEYTFTDKVTVNLKLEDKDASRYSEIISLAVNPVVNNKSRYTFNKLGSKINPLDVVGNGSKIMHALDSEINYQATDKKFSIKAIDSRVVSIGQIDNLDFQKQYVDINNGFYFHLLNTTWGTNFTMWYQEDIEASFEMEF